MQMLDCPNCGRKVGFKRAFGFGTLFAVILTGGLWLLVLPWYPVRCINCGLRRSSARWANPEYRRAVYFFCGALAFVTLAIAVLSVFGPSPASPTVAENPALAAIKKEVPTGWANVSFLGFIGGESGDHMAAHASTLGFMRVGDCKPRDFFGTPDPEYTDCKFSGNNGETMDVSFYYGHLQRLDYTFKVSRYDEILEEIKKTNGTPRLYGDGPAQAMWGAGSWSISMVKTADGIDCVAGAVFGPPLDSVIPATSAESPAVITQPPTQQRPAATAESEGLQPRALDCNTQCRHGLAAAMSADLRETAGSSEYYSADGADGARLVFHTSEASQERGSKVMAQFSHKDIKMLCDAGFTKFVLTDDRGKAFEWDLAY